MADLQESRRVQDALRSQVRRIADERNECERQREEAIAQRDGYLERLNIVIDEREQARRDLAAERAKPAPEPKELLAELATLRRQDGPCRPFWPIGTSARAVTTTNSCARRNGTARDVTQAEGDVINFTYAEVKHLLDCLARVHGPGYAKDGEVARLQSKLSMTLEVRSHISASLEKEPLIAMPPDRTLRAALDIMDKGIRLLLDPTEPTCGKNLLEFKAGFDAVRGRMAMLEGR